MTGGGEAEYPSEKEAQTSSPYHKGNPAASKCYPRKGIQRVPSVSLLAKATEGVKNLDSSPEELSGVGGAECWDSQQSNKGDLSRSWVHHLRKA